MRIRILAGWLVLLLEVVPLLAAPNAKAPAAPVTPTGDKLAPGSYTGKLLSLPSSDGAFTLEITTQVTEYKSNADYLLQLLNKFQYDYQNGLVSIQRDLATGKDTLYHQNRLRDHLIWYQNNLPHYSPGGGYYPLSTRDVVTAVDFQAAPDYKVRVLELPVEFDDKGKPRKRTQAELKELKGKDRNLPGYEAKKEELNTGALVKITLVRPKAPPKSEITAKELLNGRKNHVTVITILSKDGNIQSILKSNLKK